ncbi:accessory gene regulator B family protein [Clostridium sp. CCUG 7971]|uniref:accessory gene regulator B family protein n=1 Tax=Clostridium sp. CCUG 7971 TaxID=2811414 RepID=UPI001ABA97EB|nr:accessory gene regulator B family protein [Clostridium sp. CCUG 7971]MBO3446279.1 accessory gene regulator B family protein [Clostridium sp. CCUG 7971]
MVRNLIKKITDDIGNHNNFSKEKKEEIEYSLLITVFEIIKIIIIISLFSILGYFKEIIVIMIVMSFTKPFIGGYHEDTQVKCLVSSIIISSMILYLSLNNQLNLISLILLNSLNIFAIYSRAPVINADMPITRVDLINRNCKLGVINSIIFSLIALVLHNIGVYSCIITWTLLIEVCLMFNKKTFFKREE